MEKHPHNHGEPGWHDGHHHEHHDCHPHSRHAPDCDDQLPLFSTVGRGIKGDTYRVTVIRQDSDEMYIKGEGFDQATKEWYDDWESNNLSGGELLPIEYNYRPFSDPPTFTMTFKYRHPSIPGKEGSPYEEWSHTTNAIPYYPNEADANNLIGSGVANLYVRDGVTSPWVQVERHGMEPPDIVDSSDGRWGQINWPEGYEPKDFRTPGPNEKWAATITFGIGGDIEIPNLDNLAKILGWSKEKLINVVNGVPGAMDGSDNVRDFILDQIGPIPGLPAEGGTTNVKVYIDNQVSSLNQRITNLEQTVEGLRQTVTNLQQTINNMGGKYDRALADILSKIYGGPTLNADGTVNWNTPTTAKIAVGNMNVFSGGSGENESLAPNFIRTDATADSENDVWVK